MPATTTSAVAVVAVVVAVADADGFSAAATTCYNCHWYNGAGVHCVAGL